MAPGLVTLPLGMPVVIGAEVAISPTSPIGLTVRNTQTGVGTHRSGSLHRGASSLQPNRYFRELRTGEVRRTPFSTRWVNKLRRRVEPLKHLSKHRPIHYVHLQLAGNVLDRNPNVLAARRLVEHGDAYVLVHPPLRIDRSHKPAVCHPGQRGNIGPIPSHRRQHGAGHRRGVRRDDATPRCVTRVP
jgi:hypothetical protein